MRRSHAHISDQELLEKFYARGDMELLGVLLERYTLVLFGVGMKYLKAEERAKDMVQQVFLKALSEIPKYRIDNIGGWLYRVAKNDCLSTLRQEQRLRELELPPDLVQPEAPDERELWHEDLSYSLMDQAIKSLKQEQRVCIVLFYYEKKSYQEISDHTGFDIKQVKSHIQNGKRNIRLMVEAWSDKNNYT